MITAWMGHYIYILYIVKEAPAVQSDAEEL